MKRFPVVTVIIAAALIAAAVLFLERVEFPDDSATRKSLPAEPRGKTGKQETPARKPAAARKKVAVLVLLA